MKWMGERHSRLGPELNWIALRWMQKNLTNEKSTLVQVMAWCRQATSHYLNQCWLRSTSPSSVTGSQWVNVPSLQSCVTDLSVSNQAVAMAAALGLQDWLGLGRHSNTRWHTRCWRQGEWLCKILYIYIYSIYIHITKQKYLKQYSQIS